MCWGLAHAYRVIFNAVHCPQGGEGAAGSESEPAGTTAGPGGQAVPVPVASTSTGDNEPGPSREQEEEPEVTIRSLSLSELQDIRKDFLCIPGKHICTWLLWCWDSGAAGFELEQREAKQLGRLPKQAGIDKAIGKQAQTLTLAVASWWRDTQTQTVDKVIIQLRHYEGSLPSSQHALVSAVEELFRGSRKWNRTCPMFHLHGPMTQLLEAGASPPKRRAVEDTHHGAPCGSSSATMGKT
uniref:Uncharacterized protein n=1 Tax=Strix occidentalis caurina TaxID=311401 RepID=A0A8D0EZ38_STROC